MFAEMVAGPDFTVKTTGRPELAVGGVTLKADPKALVPTEVKAAIVWLLFVGVGVGAATFRAVPRALSPRLVVEKTLRVYLSTRLDCDCWE